MSDPKYTDGTYTCNLIKATISVDGIEYSDIEAAPDGELFYDLRDKKQTYMVATPLTHCFYITVGRFAGIMFTINSTLKSGNVINADKKQKVNHDFEIEEINSLTPIPEELVEVITKTIRVVPFLVTH